MPFYAYVLRSLKNGRRYFGSCEHLELRLSRHNAGRVKSTKGNRPYEIIYSEEFSTRSEAYIRERFFKTIPGYIFLKEKGIL